jgi:hypothetical protein
MTEWFNKTAGDDFSVREEDEGMVLLGDQTPDWVCTPPELGSQRMRVIADASLECPMCQDGAPVKHLICERVAVAECHRHGFVWYTAKGRGA